MDFMKSSLWDGGCFERADKMRRLQIFANP